MSDKGDGITTCEFCGSPLGDEPCSCQWPDPNPRPQVPEVDHNDAMEIDIACNRMYTMQILTGLHHHRLLAESFGIEKEWDVVAKALYWSIQNDSEDLLK